MNPPTTNTTTGNGTSSQSSVTHLSDRMNYSSSSNNSETNNDIQSAPTGSGDEGIQGT
jgi:hypothetical protein